MKGKTMRSAQRTIQLPAEEVDFLENYAREHRTTVAEIVERYVKRLKRPGSRPLHPDILSLTGLVPEHMDAQAEYRRHLLEKHR